MGAERPEPCGVPGLPSQPAQELVPEPHTVDGVQPNEAYGQVEGKIEKIQKDVEVKTQL